MLLSSFAENLELRSSDPTEMSLWHLGKKIFSPRPKQSPGPPNADDVCAGGETVGGVSGRKKERERESDAPGLQNNAEKNRRLFFYSSPL